MLSKFPRSWFALDLLNIRANFGLSLSNLLTNYPLFGIAVGHLF